ncbi:MAG: hypothetical protein AB1558_07865 [Thermodesulfobacteriota bacterium]
MKIITLGTAAAFISLMVIGCAVPGPRVPIINPQKIDQKEAGAKLIPKFCDVLVKTNRTGFETATAICRQLQTGEVTLEKVKASDNGRYIVFLFKEKGDSAGPSGGNHAIAAFYFNPGSEVIRSCDENGLCDVFVRNGVTRFGRSDITVHGEPMVNDRGISVKFNENRSFAYDLLFSYGKDHQREGNELISLFLSAFPVLDYQ